MLIKTRKNKFKRYKMKENCMNKTCKAKLYKSIYGGYSNNIRSNRQYFY